LKVWTVARHKEFDVEVALSEAMILFWEKGYGNTSLQDLVRRMGVHKRSMYDTFGDKRTLFLRALNRYADSAEAAYRERSAEAGSALKALRLLFEWSVEQSDARPSGCLIVNSTAEFALRDPEVAARVERNFAEQRRLLKEIVERGQREGDIDRCHDADVLAATLFNASLGLRVQARVVTDRELLMRMVEGALAAVR
jgi:TetR/AcrR family transcriptional regulator, transcriptional repressor for nem operon